MGNTTFPDGRALELLSVWQQSSHELRVKHKSGDKSLVYQPARDCPQGRCNLTERKLYGESLLWRINPSATEEEVTACLFFLQHGLNYFITGQLIFCDCGEQLSRWHQVQIVAFDFMSWPTNARFLLSNSNRSPEQTHWANRQGCCQGPRAGLVYVTKAQRARQKGRAFSLRVWRWMHLNGDEWDKKHKQLLSLCPLSLHWLFSSSSTGSHGFVCSRAEPSSPFDHCTPCLVNK